MNRHRHLQSVRLQPPSKMVHKRCAVMTQSHTYLVVPENWVQNPKNELTKIVYSVNERDQVDFKIPVRYFFK